MILKHSILQLLKEYEALKLSEIASKLNTNEVYVRVTIEQMVESGTPVKLREDIVYISSKRTLLPMAVASFLIGVIVILPAWMGLN